LRGQPSRRGAGAAWRAFGAAATSPPPHRGRRLGEAVLVAAAALLGIGMYVAARSREADRSRPPRGRFVQVDGVRVHVVTRGEGPPVVLLHGNGSMVDELEASGVLDILARHYRVVALDRPGSGYSERLPDGAATARAQAALVASVLDRLGIDRATSSGIRGARSSRSRWRSINRNACAGSCSWRATTIRRCVPTRCCSRRRPGPSSADCSAARSRRSPAACRGRR
jgi:hypothetical protein